MKNLTSTLGGLALALTAALTLGSCSRAEYATLPRSTPYLGSTPVAATRQVAPAPAAATPAQAPVAAVQTEAVVTMPAAPVAATSPAPAPAARAATPTATVSQVTPHKLSLVQRLAVAKVTKKINKIAAKLPQLKQGDTASTTRGGLDERLRTAILLTLVAIVVGILGGIVGSNFIGVVAGVIFVVALIFVILYLIDQV